MAGNRQDERRVEEDRVLPGQVVDRHGMGNLGSIYGETSIRQVYKDERQGEEHNIYREGERLAKGLNEGVVCRAGFNLTISEKCLQIKEKFACVYELNEN